MGQLTRSSVIGHEGAAGTILLAMSTKDLPLVVAAIATVRREIDSQEFSTRLGTDEVHADALRALLAAAHDQERVSGPRRPAAPLAEEIVLAVTEDDLSLINNALNEVLNGLSIAEGSLPPGPERDRAEALLETAHRMLKDARAKPDVRRVMGRPILGR